MEREQGSAPNSNLLLHGVGEVVLTLDGQGLSWRPSASIATDASACCFGYKAYSKFEHEIKFSDIYAVELFKGGLIREKIPRMRGLMFGSCPKPEMHHFVVHCFQRSSVQQCLWIPTAYIFGNKELKTCQKWIQKIEESLSKEVGRPKSLLVFVHPLSGRGKGGRTWESVCPIFCRANVKTKVIMTERAGHAFDVTTSMTDDDLVSFDGIIAVGGDGFFNEILNGLLLSRHRTLPMHSPEDIFPIGNRHPVQCSTNNTSADTGLFDDTCGTLSIKDCEDVPLLQHCNDAMPSGGNVGKQVLPVTTDHSVLSFPNDHFRLGLIPAGSTDSVVISTTGARDAVTSALHIVLGKSIRLDIAQIVRWKTCSTSNHAPSMRYAASFAGYGFYGDVVKESEKYRWMGPRRYDYAGTKVFLRHSSYDAEVRFLEDKNSRTLLENGSTTGGTNPKQISLEPPREKVCRVSCKICSGTKDQDQPSDTAHASCAPENLRWLQRKGRFHCIGAAVISCRNERAPDGLVADAHLADGFMHLILIKECPRPFYLWHLTKLTRRGSNPLDFNFVEHHRTPAFTFETSSNESIWNLDGELFQACHLSARVFRGLINMFAAGPEI